ncbi:MAG: hypothetical protein MRY49_02390 [Candidatus Pacebacteria bacterium]|nr:hypothetical protein [Candidatus Paceibacterota bacterium]
MNKDKIKETLKNLLDKLYIESEITEEESELIVDTVYFNIQTSDSNLLIGHDGDRLRALNHLMSRMFPGEEKFLIDVNRYHLDKLNSIKQKALFAANRAKSYRTKVDLDPMNSYERMIVHSVFADSLDFKTHSEGIGQERHIIIEYVGD